MEKGNGKLPPVFCKRETENESLFFLVRANDKQQKCPSMLSPPPSPQHPLAPLPVQNLTIKMSRPLLACGSFTYLVIGHALKLSILRLCLMDYSNRDEYSKVLEGQAKCRLDKQGHQMSIITNYFEWPRSPGH
jgi:hypothetical protein